MLIPHPLLGPRDAQEFVYFGPATLIDRPEIAVPPDDTEAALDTFHEYLFLRDNPAGLHRELWFHEQGDRSWLVVTRDTRTHEISGAELAVDVARAIGRGRGPAAPAPKAAAAPGAPNGAAAPLAPEGKLAPSAPKGVVS